MFHVLVGGVIVRVIRVILRVVRVNHSPPRLLPRLLDLFHPLLRLQLPLLRLLCLSLDLRDVVVVARVNDNDIRCVLRKAISHQHVVGLHGIIQLRGLRVGALILDVIARERIQVHGRIRRHLSAEPDDTLHRTFVKGQRRIRIPARVYTVGIRQHLAILIRRAGIEHVHFGAALEQSPGFALPLLVVVLELHAGQHNLLLDGNCKLRADALHQVAHEIVAANKDGDVHGRIHTGRVNHDDANGNLFAFGFFPGTEHIPHFQPRGGLASSCRGVTSLFAKQRVQIGPRVPRLYSGVLVCRDLPPRL